MLRLLRRIFKPFPPFLAPDGFTWVLELDGRWRLEITAASRACEMIADVVTKAVRRGAFDAGRHGVLPDKPWPRA